MRGIGMEGCIFCKIAAGKVPAQRFWEDDSYFAILDLYPIVRGQSLVMPKAHRDSYVFKLPDRELADFVLATKRVAKILEKKLGVKRVTMVWEGLEAPHLHSKLYPYYEGHDGVTRMGPRAEEGELKEMQRMLTVP